MNTRKYDTIAWIDLLAAIDSGLTLREVAAKYNLSLQGLRQAASLINELEPEYRRTMPNQTIPIRSLRMSDPFNRYQGARYGNA